MEMITKATAEEGVRSICNDLEEVFKEYLENLRPYMQGLNAEKIKENRDNVLSLRKQYKDRLATILTKYSCIFERVDLLNYVSYDGTDTVYRIARFQYKDDSTMTMITMMIDLQATVEWDWDGNYWIKSVEIIS